MTRRAPRAAWACAALAGLLGAMSLMSGATASEPLATLEHRVVTVQLVPEKTELAVPKGLKGSLLVELVTGDGSESDVGDFGLAQGAHVEATLRGPSFPARTVYGLVGEALVLPSMALSGSYSLDAIRLVDSETGETRLEANPSSVAIEVFDEVLVTTVTSHPLTLEEIQELGIVIDEENMQVVEFEIGLVIDGETFEVEFPVVSPTFNQSTETIPQSEIDDLLVEAKALNDQVTVDLPEKLQNQGLDIELVGVNFQVVEPSGEEDLALKVPPIPGLVVIPGKIGFLNQFFAVQLFVANGSPSGSGLSVYDIDGTMTLPVGQDMVPATSYSEPGDDPLRFARVGEDAVIEPVQRVASAGADGAYGGEDDVERLHPGQTGRAEFLVEGLKEGLHTMDISLTAKLDGFAAGIMEITGTATGAVLVRNPNFSMAFAHPRTIRTGEPYEASVTLLNTSMADANLVTVTLPSASISGGTLTSAETVELGTIKSGETKTATFEIVAERTGAISFSNITGDDEVDGVFWLSMGVDERGVALSPDTIGYPDYIDDLPGDLFAAANRVLGQALSVATAAQLPPGVKYLSTDSVTRKIIELAEAGQRLRYGDSLDRVLPDLALDWLGARYHTKGFAQIVRSTDAGRAFREALTTTLETTDGLDAIGRLDARRSDLAGRGEAWLVAAVDAAAADITYSSAEFTAGLDTSTLIQGAGYRGAAGHWLIAKPVTEGDLLTWDLSAATGEVRFATLQLGTEGQGTLVSWTVEVPVEGACYALLADEAGLPDTVAVDLGCDGTSDDLLTGTVSAITEAAPEVLAVVQDISARVGRPENRCLNEPFGNYGTVIATLFSKPMTQEAVNKPSSYVLDRGDVAGSVKVQPGGRVALLNLKSAVGVFAARELNVSDLTDPRGNELVASTLPIQSVADDGISVAGTVRRANGTLAANVPVTLTAYDLIAGLVGCEPFTVRVSQTFTDADGRFTFDFVLADVPYSVSATDTFGLDADTIQLVVNAMSGDTVSRSKLYTLAEEPGTLNSLFEVFEVDTVDAALDAIQGLDRAIIHDKVSTDSPRIGTEVPIALRFRGRGAVNGTVWDSEGSVAAGAAVNLYPDPDSREKARGMFSNASGQFNFSGVPLGIYSVDVQTSEGHHAIVAGTLEEVDELDTLDIHLPAVITPFGGLNGQVLEADGVTPHEGATVLVGYVNATSMENVVAMVKSDADGSWSTNAVPVGSWDALALSYNGKLRATRLDVQISDGVDSYVTLTLPGTATVSGKILFSDGSFAVGALVAGGEAIVTTDATGAFTLTGVPTGESAITAALEAGVMPGVDFTRLGSVLIDVLPGVDNTAIVQLRSAGRIYGTIYNAVGEPQPNVTVAIPSTGGFMWVEADEDGHYEFAPMPLGEYFMSAPAPATANTDVSGIIETLQESEDEDELLAAIGEAYAIFTGANDPLLNGQGQSFNPGSWGYSSAELNYDSQSTQVDITYLPNGTVSGTVKNDKGTPIGAQVRLTGIGPNTDGTLGFIIRSDVMSDPALGTYSFDGAAMVGSFGLQAATPFYPVVVTHDGQTTLANPDATDILLQFPEDAEMNGRLTGTVYTPEGTTAGAGVPVAISFGDDYVIQTDEDGRFDTQIDLPAIKSNGHRISYEIIATDPTTGLTGRTIALMSPGVTTDVAVTLLSQGNLSITVLDGEGALVSGASLEVRQAGFPHENFDVLTGADGTYTLTAITVGDYSVGASSISGPTTIYGRSGVEVLTGETATVTVTLEDTGTIEGIFLEEDEATPVVSAQLSVGNLGFTTTDPEGKFEVVGVPLGTYKITGQNPVNGKYAESSGTVSQQGQTVWVTLIERPSGELNGVVYDSDGVTPLPGAFVTVVSSAPYAPAQTVTSDAEGIYSVPAIPAGQVSVTARHPTDDKVTGSSSATLPEDYTSYQLDVYMKPLADLTIQVYEADGETPATNATIDFGAGQGNSDTDPQGQARFEGMTLKAYTIQVSSLDPNETRNIITVEFTLDTPGEQPVLEVTLPGVGEVTGIVFASDGVTPVVDAVMEIEFLVSDFYGETDTTLTDIDGNYLFTNVPAGPFEIRGQSGALGASDSGEITEDGQIVTVDLMLEASGTVTGRLVRADGITPVAAHTVVLTYTAPSGAFASSPVVTDDDGFFEKSLLPLFTDISLSATLDEVGGIALAEAYLSTDGEVLDIGDMVLDEEDPTVVSVDPEDGAVDVGAEQNVTLTFSEEITDISISGIYIAGTEGAIGSTLTVVSDAGQPTVLEINPYEPLDSQAHYDVVVLNGTVFGALGGVNGTGPSDLYGKTLITPFLSDFTVADVNPPELESMTPEDQAVQVDPSAVVRLTFSEPVAIEDVVVTMQTSDGTPVAGTVELGLDGYVLVFTPNAELSANAAYTVTVDGVQDAAGNPAVGQPYTADFATLDTLGPTIAELRLKGEPTPEAHAPVTVEAVLETPESNVRIVITADLVSVGESAIDLLEVPYMLPAEGEVTLRAVALDAFDNEGPTAELPLTVQANAPPTITWDARLPAGDIVQLNQTISVTVSTTDLTGVSSLALSVEAPFTVDPVSSDGEPLTLSFEVPTDLEPNDAITITATAVDVSGDAATDETAWNVSPDATPPTLVDWTPDNGEVHLPTTPLMRLHFDEAMAAESVTASTFVLTDETDTIIDTFAVLMDEDTVALCPGSALTHGATYTLTVVESPTDVAGNAATLDGETSLDGWSATFTTVSEADIAGAIYMTSGIQGNDVLDLMGWRDGTTVTVRHLEDDTTLYEGTLNSFETMDVDLNYDRVRVDASAPLFVHHGGNHKLDGTVYYPSLDGLNQRAGKRFKFYIPHAQHADEIRVLAWEAADVTIMDTNGTPVSTHSFTEQEWWNPGGLDGPMAYEAVSTGRISIMRNANTGYAPVPTLHGGEVGTTFAFGAKGMVALFAYEDAEVTIRRIDDANNILIENQLFLAGTYGFEQISGGNTNQTYWVAESTGLVGMWAGAYYPNFAMEYMGKDMASIAGLDNTSFVFNTMEDGARVYALSPDTQISWYAEETGETTETTLGLNEMLELPGYRAVQLSASKKVVVHTYSNTSSASFGTMLLPVNLYSWGRFDIQAVPGVEVAAGAPFDLTVRAIDRTGQTRTDFVGTVTLGAETPDAVIPEASYTFSAEDAGVITVSGVILPEPNVWQLTATDAESGDTGWGHVIVNPSNNPCWPNPCLYDGECSSDGETITCDCAPGYSGELCELSPCLPNPCLNAGTCAHGGPDFEDAVCTCEAGFSGDICEIDDPCVPTPCLHDGVCAQDGEDSFTCACTGDWTGAACEVMAGLCTAEPCLNGGTCVDVGDDGFSCDCAPGFEGATCETEVDECVDGACENGGTCLDAVAGYTCICNMGYSGATCSEGPTTITASWTQTNTNYPDEGAGGPSKPLIYGDELGNIHVTVAQVSSGDDNLYHMTSQAGDLQTYRHILEMEEYYWPDLKADPSGYMWTAFRSGWQTNHPNGAFTGDFGSLHGHPAGFALRKDLPRLQYFREGDGGGSTPPINIYHNDADSPVIPKGFYSYDRCSSGEYDGMACESDEECATDAWPSAKCHYSQGICIAGDLSKSCTNDDAECGEGGDCIGLPTLYQFDVEMDSTNGFHFVVATRAFHVPLPAIFYSHKPWGSEHPWPMLTRIDQMGDAESSSPTVVVDQDDRAHVVFASGGDLYHVSIEDGVPSVPMRITNSETILDQQPDLRVGPNNTLHLAWYADEAGEVSVYYANNINGHWSAPLIVGADMGLTSAGDNSGGVGARFAIDVKTGTLYFAARAEDPDTGEDQIYVVSTSDVPIVTEPANTTTTVAAATGFVEPTQVNAVEADQAVFSFQIVDATDGLPTEVEALYVEAGSEQTTWWYDSGNKAYYGLNSFLASATLTADTGETIEGVVGQTRFGFGDGQSAWLTIPDGESRTLTVTVTGNPWFYGSDPADSAMHLRLSGLYGVDVAASGSQMSRTDTVVESSVIPFED